MILILCYVCFVIMWLLFSLYHSWIIRGVVISRIGSYFVAFTVDDFFLFAVPIVHAMSTIVQLPIPFFSSLLYICIILDVL